MSATYHRNVLFPLWKWLNVSSAFICTPNYTDQQWQSHQYILCSLCCSSVMSHYVMVSAMRHLKLKPSIVRRACLSECDDKFQYLVFGMIKRFEDPLPRWWDKSSWGGSQEWRAGIEGWLALLVSRLPSGSSRGNHSHDELCLFWKRNESHETGQAITRHCDRGRERWSVSSGSAPSTGVI